MSSVSENLSADNSVKNQAIAETLERKYGTWLGQRYFEVETRSDKAVFSVEVILRNADKSFVYPIEGRIMYADQDMTLDAARDFLIDFIDAYIQEYLSGGEETYLTIDWSNYECDGIELQMRGQILNLKLEELADQWINGSGVLH